MSGPAHLRIEVLYLYVLQQQDWRTQQKVQQEKCANRKNVHSESTKQTEHEELRGSVRWTGFSWCSEKQSLSRSSMVPNLIPADTPTYLGPHLYRHNWCVCKLPECWKKKKKNSAKPSRSASRSHWCYTGFILTAAQPQVLPHHARWRR